MTTSVVLNYPFPDGLAHTPRSFCCDNYIPPLKKHHFCRLNVISMLAGTEKQNPAESPLNHACINHAEFLVHNMYPLVN